MEILIDKETMDHIAKYPITCPLWRENRRGGRCALQARPDGVMCFCEPDIYCPLRQNETITIKAERKNMEIVISKETMETLETDSLSACPFLYESNRSKIMCFCVLGTAAGGFGKCYRSRGNGEEADLSKCPLKIGETITITIKCGEAKGEEDNVIGVAPGVGFVKSSDIAKGEDMGKMKAVEVHGGPDYLELDKSPADIKDLIEAARRYNAAEELPDKVMSLILKFIKHRIDTKQLFEQVSAACSLSPEPAIVEAISKVAKEAIRRHHLLDEIVERLAKCLSAEGVGMDYLEMTESPEYIRGARETMQDVLDMIEAPTETPAIVDGIATRPIAKGEKVWLSQQEVEFINRKDK